MNVVDGVMNDVQYRGCARLEPSSPSLPCPSARSSGPRAPSVLRRKLSSSAVYSQHVLYSDHDCEVIEESVIDMLG